MQKSHLPGDSGCCEVDITRHSSYFLNSISFFSPNLYVIAQNKAPLLCTFAKYNWESATNIKTILAVEEGKWCCSLLGFIISLSVSLVHSLFFLCFFLSLAYTNGKFAQVESRILMKLASHFQNAYEIPTNWENKFLPFHLQMS